MNKLHEEPGKKGIFYGVLLLFLVSVAVLIYGVISENSSTEEPLPGNNAIINQFEEDSSLSEYFENIPSSNREENTELYYLETDPFREQCQSEGGSFGTRCYY